MLEIGKERTLTYASRGMANVFFSLGAVLALVWLARGWLGFSQYSQTLLIAAFGFGFLARAFRTNINRGAARAVSSFLGNMAFACFFSIILIWFFGWVATLQGDSLPAVFASNIPELAIAAITLGLTSFVVGAAPLMVGGTSLDTKELKPGGPALLMKQGSTTDLGEARLSVKNDSIGLPVRKWRRTVGCFVMGDVSAIFETPMGRLNATFAGPVTSFGVPFRGEKATGGQIEKSTGKSLKEIVKETRVETSEMPVARARRDGIREPMDRVTLDVTGGQGGETVKIGPVSILMDGSDMRGLRRGWRECWRERFSARWSLKGDRDSSYITYTGDGVKAKWNGSVLDFKQGSMKLEVGSDGFTYTPHELETYTPLHTLKVTKDRLTLNTKRFTLDVIGPRVILRTQDGSRRTNSEDLARDLRTLLAETAKEQVSDVLEGQPIELDEMLNGTEELLKKYA